MSQQLRVLIVEDCADDAELAVRALSRAGYEVQHERVETAEAMCAALRREPWDLILSDHTLPQFSAPEALAVLQAAGDDLPFIILSGTMGEETAVAALKAGAHDYLVKGKLARLGPAVERELRDAGERRQRRQAEAALRESEARFRALVETAFDWIWEVDAEGRYTYASPRVRELLGYAPEEVVGRTPFDLMPEDEAEKIGRIFAGLAARRNPFAALENINLHKDGRRVVLETSGVPVFGPGGEFQGYRGMDRDVTRRKQAEAEVQRLALVVEQAAEMIAITDTRGMICYVNPAFERITGYSRQEALGSNPRLLKSGKHPAAFYRQMWATLARGEAWRGHLCNRRKDGALIEENAVISPLRDAGGQTVNYVAIKLDVTREAQLEAQFRQAQKLEAIGQLAGGVAHDFNNLLAAAKMQLGLLQMNPGHDEDTREALQELDAAMGRAGKLTRQLLAFSRRSVMTITRLDLNQVVRNLLVMLKRLIGERVDLRFEERLLRSRVAADEGMMEQVLLNLVVNARDAMPNGGPVTITTTEESISEENTAAHPHRRPGTFVVLQVADAGCGMDEETLKRIFEPFFTTTEAGKGTGLGLATVHGIIAQHQGWVEVDSAVGRGTTFRIYLPAVAGPAGTENPGPPAPPIRRGGETILLVEDDKVLRQAAAQTLRRLGYRVHEAANGPAALEQWQRHGSQVQLLLTDQAMPGGMTGLELADQLQKKKPGMKVIVSSGHVAFNVQGARPGITLLPKPFELAALAEAVRNCLDPIPQTSVEAGASDQLPG
jgi:PAS domain S-box-containing protein